MPHHIPDCRHNAFEFVDRVERLSSVDEVMRALEGILAQFGFEAIMLAGLAERHFQGSVLAAHWPSEFLDLYTKQNYIMFDPIARLARRSQMPFQWDKSSYAHEQDPRVFEVMRRAADFRIARGFVVPIHGRVSGPAVVSMSGVRLDVPPASKPAIHLIALYAFDRVCRLCPSPRLPKPRITAREREVLVWVTQGKSAWQIGEILNIAKRTVDEHVQTACRKLGAANRTQAVAIALRERLLDI
jgi:LuxR family transcriptional regulator, quorum-sensing system regulator BjaR1